MMKQAFLLVFLAMIFMPLNCIDLCEEECPCHNDDPCKYYCKGGKCQPKINYGSICSSHYVHPRECGDYGYCDPYSNCTCELKKSNGIMCNTSWSCSSDYCDLTLKTCQYKPDSDKPNSSSKNFMLYILIPGCIFLVIFFSVVAIFANRINNRRLAAVRQTHPTVIAFATVYTIEDATVCGESPPPAYNEVNTNENVLVKD